jgi:hypothetical protein
LQPNFAKDDQPTNEEVVWKVRIPVFDKMDETLRCFSEKPFAEFNCSGRNSEETADEEQGFDEELEELFSDDEYDLLPNRTVYLHREICPPSVAENQDPSFNFSGKDVELPSPLIDGQSSPGTSFPRIGLSKSKEDGFIPGPATDLPLLVSRTRHISPLPTSDVSDDISSHNFPPIRTDANVSTLFYHFNTRENSNRRHRHQPRRVNLAYDDLTACPSEEEQAGIDRKKSMPLEIAAGAKPIQKGMR